MNKQYLDKVFSADRMRKYFDLYPGDEAKAVSHYQCNVEISESFYPCISSFEIALRNAVNRELITRFKVDDWYTHFPTTAGLEILVRDISRAENQITKRGELVSPSKVIAELTFGFWVSLFNVKFEMILWKDLRRAFPYLPKGLRKRKTVSTPLNILRNIRNRIFHNEPICWNPDRLQAIHVQMLEVMDWINKDLSSWLQPFDRFDSVLADVRNKLA